MAASLITILSALLVACAASRPQVHEATCPDAAGAAGICAGGLAEPPVLLQRGTAKRGRWMSPALRVAVNVYERVDGVGAWGGWCTCPDGRRYSVGDRNDGCSRGRASLACVGGEPGECMREADPAREGMEARCAAPAAGSSEEVLAPTWEHASEGVGNVYENDSNAASAWRCLVPASWPDVVDGVTCEACAALVKTAPYGGRRDRYCESFGQVCTAAAEEVANTCEVLERKAATRPSAAPRTCSAHAGSQPW